MGLTGQADFCLSSICLVFVEKTEYIFMEKKIVLADILTLSVFDLTSFGVMQISYLLCNNGKTYSQIKYTTLSENILKSEFSC